MCVEWTRIKFHVIKLTNINLFFIKKKPTHAKTQNEVGIQAKANWTCNLNAITLLYRFVSNSKNKAKSVDQNNKTTNSTEPNHTHTVQHNLLAHLTRWPTQQSARLFIQNTHTHKYHPTRLIKPSPQLSNNWNQNNTQNNIEHREKNASRLE